MFNDEASISYIHFRYKLVPSERAKVARSSRLVLLRIRRIDSIALIRSRRCQSRGTDAYNIRLAGVGCVSNLMNTLDFYYYKKRQFIINFYSNKYIFLLLIYK